MKKFSLLTATTLLFLVGFFLYPNLDKMFSYQSDLNFTQLDGIFKKTDKAIFNNDKIYPPPLLAHASTDQDEENVLGENDSNKRIEIDLTNQRLLAYEGNRKIYEFVVSTGKWGRTPTGTFDIWIKLRYTTMSGGSKALGTYYYLPNVPYTMYFYNDDIPKHRGFGIHGTYWHNNFGQPMSHGCINMKTEDVEKLYKWAMPDEGDKSVVYATEENPGTKVVIYGEAPM